MKINGKILLLSTIFLILVLAVLPMATACSTSTTDTTKTLKIGFIGWLGFYMGLDTLDGLQLMVDIINQEGGLAIGGEEYTIELIPYDSNNDQATMTAAANRLIFEDDVKFIVSDGVGIEAIIPITEANQVILCTGCLSTEILSPDNHYSFNVSFIHTGTPIITGWLANAYPDLKSIVMALPDSQIGHLSEVTQAPSLEAFGFDYAFEYYPADATDLSSLGTKVSNVLNPDIFATVGTSFQPYAAVGEAGYEGQLFYPAPTTTANLLTQCSPEELEGLIGAATTTEFEPPITQIAQDFKEAWITEFGSWEDPETSGLASLSCLVTALQEAGSLDVEAVASVIGSGLQFDTVNGPAMMVSRPDIGNDRTTDCIMTIYMKQLVNGEPVLVATIDVDEGLSYFQQILDY